MKYLIHACKSRMWYVKCYLIPSMLEQGITEDEIDIYLDENDDVCLRSCMKSFMNLPDKGDTWHLQDDVLLSKRFHYFTGTIKFDGGIICGFCSDTDINKNKTGEVTVDDMWYSFPCIRIPNKIAKECAKWYYSELEKGATDIKFFDRINKHDDLIFRAYVTYYCPENTKVLLVTPNLVNHVDYLLGGTTVNYQRKENKVLSAYWNELRELKELEKVLKQ